MINPYNTLALQSCESFHKDSESTAPQAEPTEGDELPADRPTAAGVAVTPELLELGEAHFWPHARMAGALAKPGAVKVVTRGDGVWVYDESGQRYFDTLSGMWLNNIGHGRREVADAVYAQICELGYAPDGSVHPATLQLAARVAALAPDPASRVFFVSGGSEGNETAMKMAKKFHRNQGNAGRYKFISRRGSYHGGTHGALILGGGGGNNGAEYGPLPYGGVRVQGPDQYRNPFGGNDGSGDLECAREIERAILNEGPDTVAAVIGEPISASAGVHIPHPEYWPMVREICDRYGVLLICDEVITGFGRTGRMFATEHWGVVPDITVVAKALTSGYVPIGAVIATKRVADAFIGSGDSSHGASGNRAFNHRITFGGNPVSCAAGLANLDILQRELLVRNAADMGGYLFGRLQELYRYEIVGQVRGGLGLICAVEIVANRATKEPFPKEARLAQRVGLLMERHGLLGRAGDILFVAPPLSVTRSELDFLVRQLEAVIAELQADLLTRRQAA